ncbi:hypothetical protein [Bdellovibrio sp. HCB209]|uniref:hypothetical protein n=1 Tax=Bdellovibrio sp. HCB209 TaxID=3394354 RepID=UPI0039B694D6
MKHFIVTIVLVAAVLVYFFRKDNVNTVDHSDVPRDAITQESQSAPPTHPSHDSNSAKAATVPQRTVASVTNVPMDTKERKLLVDLIRATRSTDTNPAMKAKAQKLREQFKNLSNKNEVVWDYYRDLQAANAPAFERVEMLDMLNAKGGDAKLAEVALAEALDFSPEKTITMEQAQNEQQRNIASTTDQNYIPVLVAYEIYLNNCGNYQACQKGLLTVIANNENHNMKASLIEAVNKQFPRSRAEFAADLARYQLN